MSLFPNFFDIRDFPFSRMLSGNESFSDLLDIFSIFLKNYDFKRNLGCLENNVTLKNVETIDMHSSVLVEAGAYICGPCILSKGCVVRHGAYIRGSVFAGENSVIGHCTEVKNSIFLTSSKAAHFAYVADSIVGKHVNLGAGVRCANLRFDKKTIKILTNSGFIDSNKVKLGSCFGNDAQIGCNVVFNPGSLVVKGTKVAPGQVKKGFIN